MVNEELLTKVKMIVKLIAGNDISEIIIEEDNFKFRVEKKGNISSNNYSAPIEKREAKESMPKAEEKYIRSPMVGTFYSAPSPDAPSFIEIGSRVEKGKPVCIIEAMKLFNEIEAEMNCKIIKTMVEDGKPVEYGQPLFLVEEL